MLLLALALQAASPAPSAEAEALGTALAEQGLIHAIVPLTVAKESEELVAAHPELRAAEKDELRRVAAETGVAMAKRLAAAFGHEYAVALSIADLRAMVAFNRTPLAQHYRAAQLPVITRAMAGLGAIDYKGDVLKAFCAKTGKACPAKP